MCNRSPTCSRTSAAITLSATDPSSIEVNGTERLPVLVPAEFNHVNIERGQRFFFKVGVEEKGVLRAQEVKKA